MDAIDFFMFRVAARRVDVVGKLALHVDQPATARAIRPVVKGGKSDDFVLQDVSLNQIIAGLVHRA